MGLSSSLSIAQSALANTAAQAALLSKNIANVNNTDYSRRSATTLTQMPGSVVLGATQRATDTALLGSLLSAQSASSSSQAISDGLTQLASALGLDNTSSSTDAAATDQSPATLISNLSNALQQYAAAPDTASLGTSVITAAKALAAGLNAASQTVQQVRQQADSGIASAVSTVNSLLAQFKTVNDAIVKGTNAGQDVSDAEDTRDGILKQLSSEMGITTVQGANNSISIYTDSGVTLFETSPRTVTFSPTATYSDGTTGQSVMVDGVPVTGSSAVMPLQSGTIAGLATLRDSTSVSYQNQLDQIASGLISAFSETPTSGSGATLPGVFTTSGATTMPTSLTGLAQAITVNASVDPSQGGDVTKLRDGNISSADSAYTYNTSDAAAFSGRLSALATALSATRSFDSTSGGTSSGSLASYAQSSVSWLEGLRQSATDDATYKSTVVSTATTALSNATGVNLDDEMSKMLDIEHAYQASAQLLNTVGSMYSALLQAFN